MEKVKKYLNKAKQNKEYIILFIVTLLIMIPFYGKNYTAGDDTDFHMSNIYALYTNIVSGTSIGLDKILPIIGHDFGYATGIFYPRLAHVFTAYVATIVGGNIDLAMKAVHFLVYFLSSLMMFKLVKRIFGNKYIALLAGIFYITFPYSITEVFRRDAFAESLVYLFMPMIVLGLYELFNGNKKSFYIWFILGYIGIINSHLVMAVYFTGLVCIYLLINIKKVFTKENFKALAISAVLILLITAPFTTGVLQNKALGIYHVFESDSMSNMGTIVNSKMEWWEFLLQHTSYKFTSVDYYLNLLALGMAIVAIIRFKKIVKDKNGEKGFFGFLVALTFATVFLMSRLCPWEYLPKLMIMIQFAWRLEAILIFALSILAALALRNVKSTKFKVLWLAIIIAFNGFTVYYTYDFDKIQPHKINDIDVSYWGMGYEKEYLPEVTIQNIEYYENRSQDIIVPDSSKTEAKVIESKTPYLKAEISNCGEETAIELPRIYYIGYKAVFTDSDGNKTKLNLYMNGNGFIETVVDKDGTIELTYEGTVLNNIAILISIATISGVLAFIFGRRVAKRAYGNLK
jgi:hypothetical protein